MLLFALSTTISTVSLLAIKDLIYSVFLFAKELVDRFHEKGLVVNCWTVDSVEELNRVMECGVDMVTSNVFEEI